MSQTELDSCDLTDDEYDELPKRQPTPEPSNPKEDAKGCFKIFVIIVIIILLHSFFRYFGGGVPMKYP